MQGSRGLSCRVGALFLSIQNTRSTARFLSTAGAEVIDI